MFNIGNGIKILRFNKFEIIYNLEDNQYIVKNIHGEYLGLNIWNLSSAEVIIFNTIDDAYSEAKKYEDRIYSSDSSINVYTKFTRFEIMEI